MKVWQTLRQKGFQCYCAGGWVRDYLLQRQSDDVDLATSASPDEVAQLFERTLALGKRFGSVVVLIEEEDHTHAVEVTTFRSDGIYTDGRRPETITPSDPLNDALRRDFTINGLFYDPEQGAIIDYVEGLEDLEKGVVRAIGNPKTRFEEDRLRILRGIRFATRLGYPIESFTFQAMKDLSPTLVNCVSPERIWQELFKINQDGRLKEALSLFHALGLIKLIFGLEIESSSFESKLNQFSNSLPLVLKLALLWSHDPSFSSEVESNLSSLKISKKEMQLLEQLSVGISWLDRLDEPTRSLEAIEWVYKAGQDVQALCEALSALRKEKATTILWKNLFEHPLVLHLREKGPLFKAQDLLNLNIPAGQGMGKILKWLHTKAAFYQSIDKQFLLSLLETDAEGQKLVEEATKGNRR